MIGNKSYRKGYSRGQALVEYVLTLMTVVLIFMAMNHIVLSSVGKLWTNMAKKVAAGCPSCTAPPEVH